MLDFCTLTAEHEHLALLAITLRRLAGSSSVPAQSCAQAIDALSADLESHLESEDRHLYCPSIRIANADFSEQLVRFGDEIRNLAAGWRAYAALWTETAIAAERPRFAEETQRVVGALLERITRENHILYPLALAACLIQLRPSPARAVAPGPLSLR